MTFNGWTKIVNLCVYRKGSVNKYLLYRFTWKIGKVHKSNITDIEILLKNRNVIFFQ